MATVNGRSLVPDYAGAFARGSQQANVLKNQRLSGQLTQQTMDKNAAANQKANQFNKLSEQYTSGQYGMGESESGVLAKLNQLDSAQAKKILEGQGVIDQRSADEFARFGYEVQNS